jgi:hypothetical protein
MKFFERKKEKKITQVGRAAAQPGGLFWGLCVFVANQNFIALNLSSCKQMSNNFNPPSSLLLLLEDIKALLPKEKKAT